MRSTRYEIARRGGSNDVALALVVFYELKKQKKSARQLFPKRTKDREGPSLLYRGSGVDLEASSSLVELTVKETAVLY